MSYCQQNRRLTSKSTVKHLEFKQSVNTEGVKYLPVLEISELVFTDENGNQAIEANENGFISLSLRNTGKGEANNIKVNIRTSDSGSLLSFENLDKVGTLYPGQSTVVYIPVKTNSQLHDGTVILKVTAEDDNSIRSEAEVLTLQTLRFRPPKVIVADVVFSTNNGKPFERNLPVFLTALVQNIGEGEADNVMAELNLPDDCIPLGKSLINIGQLQRGDVREIQFSFVPTKNYPVSDIPLEIKLKEELGEYASDKKLSVTIGDELLAINSLIKTSPSIGGGDIVIASLTAEVDKNIPVNQKANQNTLALIIGNEDYYSRQSGNSYEANVDFARNDARIFREYTISTLGIDEKNIFFMLDATAAEMKEAINLVTRLASKIGTESNIVFYYAGHGLPDEVNRTPYLIPVDVSGSNLQAAIPLKEIYSQLGNSGASKITIFLDACFSGGGRNSGLLAARAVRVKPKEELLLGNIVVFSASSNEQIALPYKEKQHGMFTYYLLKKLQESNGEVTYGELSEYLEKNVAIESLRINHKDQEPKVDVSNKASDLWEEWGF